jgi:hypothetical protein
MTAPSGRPSFLAKHMNFFATVDHPLFGGWGRPPEDKFLRSCGATQCITSNSAHSLAWAEIENAPSSCSDFFFGSGGSTIIGLKGFGRFGGGRGGGREGGGILGNGRGKTIAASDGLSRNDAVGEPRINTNERKLKRKADGVFRSDSGSLLGEFLSSVR